mmetsp:Transcript_14308/g.25574  ORF Transcript_14308/g.25574 Transcript_14308/m.25574 type:complete len:89 (+) Transcript_14308:1458-1724(+)
MKHLHTDLKTNNKDQCNRLVVGKNVMLDFQHIAKFAAIRLIIWFTVTTINTSIPNKSNNMAPGRFHVRPKILIIATWQSQLHIWIQKT